MAFGGRPLHLFGPDGIDKISLHFLVLADEGLNPKGGKRHCGATKPSLSFVLTSGNPYKKRRSEGSRVLSVGARAKSSKPMNGAFASSPTTSKVSGEASTFV